MSDGALAFRSIAELGRGLRAKEFSSVELTQSCLNRLEKTGPRLNSVVTLMPQRALAHAKQADDELAQGHDRGPLHGIPYGAKDLIAAKGASTTWGAAPYRHQRFDYDATVIERLSAAGAVLVAKLAMIELAGAMGYNQSNASFTGSCKTPWNLNHWSGGSSSGSGASVAAGLVPFAIGSETDGSITNPASYCGVTGLRPTYGRVSRYGAMALSWSLDKIGPLCRSAQDAAIVLGAIAGHDPKDPTSVNLPVPADVGSTKPAVAKRWRLGILKDATKKVQPEVKRNFESAIHSLTAVATVEHIALPDMPYNEIVGAIIAGDAASAFRDIIEDGRVQTLADPDGRRGGYSYLVVNAVDYVDAMRERALIRSAFDNIFHRVDAIVAPTFSTVAYPLDVPFDKAYPGTDDGNLITACNLAGVPAISVPDGFGKHGLPTGLMFVAPSFAETRLVELATAFQERTDFHLKRPHP